METLRGTLPPLLLAALLLAAPGCSGGRPGKAEATLDTASGYSGVVDDLNLDDYRGRVVLLNFWATWCPPCRAEIPDLVRLRKDFAGEEVAILGISIDDRQRARVHSTAELESVVRTFIKRANINYPVYLDEEQELAGHFSGGFMAAVPTTILLDREGRVRGMHSGLPRGTDGRPDPYGVLARELQALLDEG